MKDTYDMFNTHKVEIDWGGRKLTLETGRMARQAEVGVLEASPRRPLIGEAIRLERLAQPSHLEVEEVEEDLADLVAVDDRS